MSTWSRDTISSSVNATFTLDISSGSYTAVFEGSEPNCSAHKFLSVKFMHCIDICDPSEPDRLLSALHNSCNKSIIIIVNSKVLISELMISLCLSVM